MSNEMRNTLTELDARFKILAENLRDYIYSLSRDGVFLYLSPAFETITGWAPAEWLGKTFHGLVHPDDLAQARTNLDRASDGGTPPPNELRVRRKDGDYITLEFVGKSIANPSDDAEIYGIARDITERKKAEEELRAAKNQAVEATKLKDKFVSLVSHDLRSPLSAILGALKDMSEDAAETGASSHNAILLDRSVSTCEGLIKMIDQLLNISRLQTGSIRPRIRFQDGYSLVNLLVTNLSPLAERKGVRLLNEVPERLRILSDYQLFYEVISNLVTNAIKFTRDGGTVTIFVPQDKPGAVAVRDTGVGINEKILDNLFKHEVKTTTVGTAGESGTGLGLPLCKDIMDAHGGSLTVESTLGEGSVFYAELPVRKPNILVVDDEELARLTLASHLARAGMSVTEASDGQEALKMLMEKAPDLIITNVIMSNLDGAGPLSRLDEVAGGRAIPVVAITASRDKETREKMFALGAADIVNKPVDENDLIPRVNRLLMMDWED
jgi:PAS domain S-box-containing protein